jgi:hypothetical protein
VSIYEPGKTYTDSKTCGIADPSDPFGTEPFKRDGFTQGFNAKGTFEGDLNALATIAGLANVTYKASVKRSSREDMVKPKEKRGEYVFRIHRMREKRN